MSRNLKNWITGIAGTIIIGWSSYSLFIEKEIVVSLIGYAIGTGLLISYNKLGKALLKMLPGYKS
jgi:hypothetical protein